MSREARLTGNAWLSGSGVIAIPPSPTPSVLCKSRALLPAVKPLSAEAGVSRHGQGSLTSTPRSPSSVFAYACKGKRYPFPRKPSTAPTTITTSRISPSPIGTHLSG